MSEYSYDQYLADQETADTLDFIQNYMHSPYEVAEKVCNGIGPSWFPSKLRKLIDKLNPTLKPVAQNHDLGYYYGRGTLGDFTRQNDAFAVNGVKAAKARYKWYDVRRYWVMKQPAKFAARCEAWGWPAYVAAIKERKADEAAKQAAQSVKEQEADV
jgi:hypothetical protein